jgi:hypothetical protein
VGMTCMIRETSVSGGKSVPYILVSCAKRASSWLTLLDPRASECPSWSCQQSRYWVHPFTAFQRSVARRLNFRSTERIGERTIGCSILVIVLLPQKLHWRSTFQRSRGRSLIDDKAGFTALRARQFKPHRKKDLTLSYALTPRSLVSLDMEIRRVFEARALPSVFNPTFITIEQSSRFTMVVDEPNGFLGHNQSCCPARQHGAPFQHKRSQH